MKKILTGRIYQILWLLYILSMCCEISVAIFLLREHKTMFFGICISLLAQSIIFYFFCRIYQIKKKEICYLQEECRKFGDDREEQPQDIMRDDVFFVKRYVDLLQAWYEDKLIHKQSSLTNLQNQINPHFLYNTLDSIRGKALESGFYEVAEMTAALSMFFRYNISSKENIVPLRDELNNIDNYFKIEQFRFGNRFSLNIDNEDPSTLDCYIPKMTLQPLIENSIFHGLEPRKGGGKIKIIVTRCQNHLAISIVDDGVGMLQDRLIQLQDSLANREALKAGRDSRHSSVGIFNINERIKRLFGTQYGMSILSVENVGTEIELILPIVERPDGIGELIAGCGA